MPSFAIWTQSSALESNRRHLIQSELLSRLISLFEKPLSLEALEPLLKLITCVFESLLALNVSQIWQMTDSYLDPKSSYFFFFAQISNIATIVLWILRFVFGDNKIADGDTSSISKTPRIRSVKRNPKSKRWVNSAAGISCIYLFFTFTFCPCTYLGGIGFTVPTKRSYLHVEALTGILIFRKAWRSELAKHSNVLLSYLTENSTIWWVFGTSAARITIPCFIPSLPFKTNASHSWWQMELIKSWWSWLAPSQRP